jgi:preprotein translocase subunit SecG
MGTGNVMEALLVANPVAQDLLFLLFWCMVHTATAAETRLATTEGHYSAAAACLMLVAVFVACAMLAGGRRVAWQENYKFKVLSMLTIIRLVVTISLIVLIVPQTNTENTLLRTFNNSNLFKNYGEAKAFLSFVTWFSIVLYLALTYFATVT